MIVSSHCCSSSLFGFSISVFWLCWSFCGSAGPHVQKKKDELVDKISWSFSTWLFVSLTAQEHTHLRTNILMCVSLHQRVPTRDPPASGMFRASIRVREGWRPAACLQRSQWGCPDPTGTRPPGFPRPRVCGGPGFGVVAVGRFYQSRSSILEPGLKHREQTAENSQPPDEKRKGFLNV